MGKQGRGGHSGRGAAGSSRPGHDRKTDGDKAFLAGRGGRGGRGRGGGGRGGSDRGGGGGQRKSVQAQQHVSGEGKDAWRAAGSKQPAANGLLGDGDRKGTDGGGGGGGGRVGDGLRHAKRQKLAHGSHVEHHARGGGSAPAKTERKAPGGKQPSPPAPVVGASGGPQVTEPAKAAAAKEKGTAAPSASAGTAAAVAAATAAAEPAAGSGGRRVANSNWETLKQAIAAAKKPPPPEHVRKKRAAAAAAAAEAAGGGRRPGVVGSETGLTKVLALDCEMVGVGPKGAQSALARVCLVNSAGAVLLDTFVQPKEKVTDYRTWVSGVRPSDLEGGRPFDDVIQQVGEMVRGRVLVGHALGHDLRALRLEEHPRSLLRDTSKYPGLMKELTGGRKVSASLKDLAATHLGLTIQEGEHSPVDDARAALYLYQKFHREWEAAIKSGQLVPVVGGLGKKAKKARTSAGAKRKGEGGKSGKAAARGKATSRRAKELGVPGVAGGGVRKREHRAGLRGRGGARGGSKAAAGAAGIWSLERDPYADL